jgi:hypothetical protein
MILEKLQPIAIVVVSPSIKARWLKWWNSHILTCEALHFLLKEFTDKELESWLNKASFWVRVNFLTFISRLEFFLID